MNRLGTISAFRCALLIGWMFTSACVAAENDTPLCAQYRCDARHTGVAPSDARSIETITLKWHTEPHGIGIYSASKSSPAVDETVVFVGVDDGRLLALSREDGAVVWSFETHRFDTERTVENSFNLGIHGTPAFDNQHVYIGDYDGYLYAVRKKDGVPVWEKKLGGSIGASPTLADGRIYTAVELPDPDGKVVVSDAATGTTLWESRLLGAHPHSTVSLSPTGDSFFAGDNNGVLHAFDATSGSRLWMFQSEGPIKSTPAVSGDTVFFTSWDKRLYAVNSQNGALRFLDETDDVTMSSPAVFESRVVFGSHDTQLYAANANTGARAWVFDTGGAILSSPTVLPKSDIVVVGSKDRYLYFVHGTDGTLAHAVPFPAGITSVPAVAGDELFVNDDSGAVWCFTMSGS